MTSDPDRSHFSGASQPFCRNVTIRNVTADSRHANSPDELAAVIKSEIPKWARLIKGSGIKPD